MGSEAIASGARKEVGAPHLGGFAARRQLPARRAFELHDFAESDPLPQAERPHRAISDGCPITARLPRQGPAHSIDGDGTEIAPIVIASCRGWCCGQGAPVSQQVDGQGEGLLALKSWHGIGPGAMHLGGSDSLRPPRLSPGRDHVVPIDNRSSALGAGSAFWPVDGIAHVLLSSNQG